MKLLCSALFVSSLCSFTFAQQIIENPCPLNEITFKVLIRKSFQANNPKLKFSPRSLKSSEICFLESIQDETEIVVHILDVRHEVVIYPSNISDTD